MFSQVWVNAKMEFGGNWTTDGSLMTTSLFTDMRSSGNWVPSSSVVFNTTGIINFFLIILLSQISLTYK